MIRLELPSLSSVDDARDMLQTAIGVEFGTLPPYLYAMFSIPPGENVIAANLIKSVLLQEMIHMCLACNMLNALGGTPVLTAPVYPGPLPGDIGPVDGDALDVHICPLSPAAMAQAMAIEEPEKVPPFPHRKMLTEAEAAVPGTGTIGQFYGRLDAFLATLPASDWTPNRNQIDDDQFFTGQLFAVNDYADAHRAITEIVSEGEGSPQTDNPLDFENDLAHYYRFGEIFYDKVLAKIPEPPGYAWGPDRLGVEYAKVYPAIDDPGSHDFANDPPAAQAAQAACNAAYSRMVDALQAAVTGAAGQLGVAVAAMFELRMAAKVAMTTPLADGTSVAGPAFLYVPPAGKGAGQ